MTQLRRLGILVAFVVGLGALLASPSGADVVDKSPGGDGARVAISKVDATNPEAASARFYWTGEVSALSSMTLRQDGTEVKGSNPEPVGEASPRATVIAIDQSDSMSDSGSLDSAIALARNMVDEASENSRFGIVTFGANVIVAQQITSDVGALNEALDGIKPSDSPMTSLWDGVVQGVDMLDELPDFEHDLIVVTDGADNASTATAKAAQSAVVGSNPDAGATVYAIGLASEGELDESGLSALVAKAGGRFFVAEEPKDLDAAFEEVMAAIAGEYVTTFATVPDSRGRVTLEMSISNASDTYEFTIGGVATGSADVQATSVKASSTPSFFTGTGGLVLGMLLIALAVGVVAYIAVQMVTSRTSALEAALNPYTEGYVAPEGSGEAAGGLSESALLQRALAMTEQFAERQGFLESLETKLDMASIPLKASEAMLIWLGASIILAVLGFFLGGILLAFVFLLIAILAAPATLNFKAAQRQRKFEAQLPDMLQLLAGALRAGFSLMQAVDAVSQEMQDPMGIELRRVVSESRLGRDLEDALEDTAERTGSADFAWAVMAIRIQREVGGNLAELLLTVADTMIQRERLRREVKALTAEGRISAYILACLPPGLGIIMYMMNPEYMSPLFHDTFGIIMLILSILGMVVGFFWMQKVVQIDV